MTGDFGYDWGMSAHHLTAEQLGLPRRTTLAEYFQIADTALERCEYRGGTVVCMPGGTEFHSLIGMNIGRAIGNRLEGGPCRVYNPDLRVSATRRASYMYPDVSVVCGPSEYDPRDPSGNTVSNPRLVVEVLSPSTASYDLDEKFHRYMHVDSFQEYVLVSQDRPRVETRFRQGDGTWSLAFANGVDATIRLRSLDIDVPLAAIYADVTFPPPAPDDAELPDPPPPS